VGWAIFSMISESVRSFSSGQNNSSFPTTPNRSRCNSSDDDSLYTSTTGATGGKKNEGKDLSPLWTYLDIHGDDGFEITGEPDNKVKQLLAQPDLSKSNYGESRDFQYREEDDVPDDEKSIGPPGVHYMSNLREKANAIKHEENIRSKRQPSNVEKPLTNTIGSTSLMNQMYDQLAALGQKKKEEKKQSYKQRNKRAQVEDLALMYEDDVMSKAGSIQSFRSDIPSETNPSNSARIG